MVAKAMAAAFAHASGLARCGCAAAASRGLTGKAAAHKVCRRCSVGKYSGMLSWAAHLRRRRLYLAAKRGDDEESSVGSLPLLSSES